MLGLGNEWNGVIQDTASTASLVALLCARERATANSAMHGGLQAETSPVTVYSSEQNHSSIEKAALLADSAGRICGSSPPMLITRYASMPCRRQSNATWPQVRRLARWSRRSAPPARPPSIPWRISRDSRCIHGLWLHVDAALAGSAMILPECRTLWQGIESADSDSDQSAQMARRGFRLRDLLRAQSGRAACASCQPTPATCALKPIAKRRTFATGESHWVAGSVRSELWFLIREQGVAGLQARLRRDLANAQWLKEQVDADARLEAARARAAANRLRATRTHRARGSSARPPHARLVQSNQRFRPRLAYAGAASRSLDGAGFDRRRSDGAFSRAGPLGSNAPGSGIKSLTQGTRCQPKVGRRRRYHNHNERSGAALWMLYGANGYTGELIAREACARQRAPILAGRNAHGDRAAGEGAWLRVAPVRLDDEAALAQALAGVSVMLHCAGPFSSTARPDDPACLGSRVHYLDITGEIEVFEWARALDEEARRAGVLLCPGAGFDVVPSDCLAAQIKRALPDATHLALGFDSRRRAQSRHCKNDDRKAASWQRRSRGRERSSAFHLRAACARSILAKDRRAPSPFRGGCEHSVPYDRHTERRGLCPRIAARDSQVTSAQPWRLLLGLPRCGLASSAASIAARPVLTRSNVSTTPSCCGARDEMPMARTVVGRVRVPNGYTTTMHTASRSSTAPSSQSAPAGFRTPSQIVGADFLSRLPGATEVSMSAR